MHYTYLSNYLSICFNVPYGMKFQTTWIFSEGGLRWPSKKPKRKIIPWSVDLWWTRFPVLDCNWSLIMRGNILLSNALCDWAFLSCIIFGQSQTESSPNEFSSRYLGTISNDCAGNSKSDTLSPWRQEATPYPINPFSTHRESAPRLLQKHLHWKLSPHSS